MVAKIKSGDRLAYADCYQRISPMIYTAIYNVCKNKQTAEDILHDTFIDIFEKINGLEDESKFLGWAKRIAFNNVLIHVRRKSIFSKVIDKITVVQSSSTEFVSDYLDQNQLIVLMNHIPEEHRLILWLFIVEQYTHKEISSFYGKSPSYSKQVVFRTLKKFNQLIENERIEEKKCI